MSTTEKLELFESSLSAYAHGLKRVGPETHFKSIHEVMGRIAYDEGADITDGATDDEK